MNDTDPNFDAKGRPAIAIMTTDEKLDELLAMGRQLADAIETLSQNPAVKMMIPGGLGR